MSESFVVDSSVALAWTFANQASEYTREVLTRQRQGSTIVVPGLWYLEIANGLVVAVRRKLITLEDQVVAKAFFKSLRVIRDDQGIDHALSETFNLSQHSGLSIYDACYLELAVRRSLPLATRDEALKAAAKKVRVELL